MTTRNFCEQCGTALPTPGGSCPQCLLGLGERPSRSATPATPAAPPSPTPAEIAPDFPQLEILELIGRGGMGVVYQARQKGLDRMVALKILPEECATDPTFAERFEREARVLARLDHPNIVRVHDAGKSGDRFWLLMEFVDGVNLRRLSSDEAVEPRESLALVTQICDALQYAHDSGVVHRDIKPENILVDRRGVVKIADFGLAKLLGQEAGGVTLTRSDQAMGTLHYMAPEQIRHPLEVDHRADIYSLGVVFYELLTGELPVGNFPLPSDQQGIDTRLDEVVLKSLEREPERRYQQVTEVRTDVERVSKVAPAASSTAGGDPVQASRRSRRGHRVGWIIAAGCLGSLFLGGVLLALPWYFMRTRQATAIEEMERAHARQVEMEARYEADAAALEREGLKNSAVVFAHVPHAVGDVYSLTEKIDREMRPTMRLGVGALPRVRESRKERKKVEVLEVTGDVVTRARVTYEEISKTEVIDGDELSAEESPLLGNSYLLSLDDGGALVVHDPRGETPSSEELEAVEKDFRVFGRSSSFHDLLPEGAVVQGSSIQLSGEVLRDLLPLDPKEGAEVEIPTAVMTLRETRVIDGHEAGLFDVKLKMDVRYEKGTMKSELEGELLLALDTCWPLHFELSGPFTAKYRSPFEGVTYVAAEGEMSVSQTSSYR
jgi:tRNA A-37 threonylcarbamoyl transferase component Bud32